MRETRRPQRAADDPGSFGAFDAIVGVALALIVGGIIVAGRAGTAIAALRASARAAGGSTGFGAILGLGIFVVVVLVVAVIALVVREAHRSSGHDEGAPTA